MTQSPFIRDFYCATMQKPKRRPVINSKILPYYRDFPGCCCLRSEDDIVPHISARRLERKSGASVKICILYEEVGYEHKQDRYKK